MRILSERTSVRQKKYLKKIKYPKSQNELFNKDMM